MRINNNYQHTLYAGYIGYVTQAIINNFAPLLFLTFQRTYLISLDKVTLLITLNFGLQLIVDMLSVKFVDKISVRKLIVFAHCCAALGLIGLSVLPELFPEPYWGLLAAIMLYAVGGGLIEVLISPIVEACPTDKKSAAMSLLHSFYCWGHVIVIIFSTLFFVTFGIEKWAFLAIAWAVVPIFNAFYFTQVPINKLVDEGERIPMYKLLKNKLFWVFVVLMVCSGASELSMGQWVSAFAESALNIPKAYGDLVGTCSFAVFMGVSRVIYSKYSEKLNLLRFMTVCGCICVISYLLAVFSPNPVLSLISCGLCGFSVGIFWPGTFSLASVKYLKAGTAMFAFLALAGDIGCSLGPTVVGMVSDATGDNLRAGLLVAIIFPVVLLVALNRVSQSNKE